MGGYTVNGECNMNYDLDLHGFMQFGRMCFYDLNSGEYKLTSPKKVDPKDIGDGDFIILDENLYALAKTADGPVFIFNDTHYYLKNDLNFKFIHEIIPAKKITNILKRINANKSKDFCKFIFEVDNMKIIDIVYEKPDEDWSFWHMDMDFFHWITEWSNNDEFIEHFTKGYVPTNS